MEIKKPTSKSIDPRIFENFEIGIRSTNSTEASQIASQINNRVALQQKLRDIETYVKNKDASGFSELLEGNQTIGEQKTPSRQNSRMKDAFEDKHSEIEQTKSRIEEEKKAAYVQFVLSCAGAAAAFATGAGATGAGAAASDSSSVTDDSKKPESKAEIEKSDDEIFKLKMRRLLA